MPRNILLLLTCLIIIFQVSAQQGLKERYETKTVYPQSRFFQSKNGLIPPREFKAMLLKFDDSKWQFDEYKKDQKTGIWMGVLSLGVMVTGGAFLEENNGLGIGLFAGAWIPYFLSISKLSQARNHYNKSIWYYNRDILLEEP